MLNTMECLQNLFVLTNMVVLVTCKSSGIVCWEALCHDLKQSDTQVMSEWIVFKGNGATMTIR